jgi:predicted AlkP superfamily pyrophosphatase or phosphodiesterase
MNRRRIGIYVMIDALGINYLRSHEFLPEFDHRVGLRTVLGYSCSCQPTLLSGKLPREHGHGAMYQRRLGASVLEPARTYSWLPGWIGNHHRIRSRIHTAVSAQVNGYFSLYECPTRLLPEFDLVEQRSIFEPGGLRRADSIFDELEKKNLCYRSYFWNRSEEENLLSAEADIQRGDVDFIFLYLPALDGLLHAHGSEGKPVADHLAWIEKWLRRLRDQAEISAEVAEMFVFSDHGMSDVHGGVDLISPIESEFGRNGGRYLAFYDSTLVRVWSDDAQVREEFVDFFRGRSEGRYIDEEEKELLGSNFPDRSQGDEVFVMNEGLLVLPSYMGKNMLAGMHGYHPDGVDTDACLLGTWSPSDDTTHIRDLHTLMMATTQRLEQERT